MNVIAAALLATLAAVSAHAADPSYPTKPVRIVVGFAPGTGPDFVARLIANKMQEAWKSGVVVDNKAGAAGFIAAQEVARAAPDGYTLLLGALAQITIAPSTYRKLPYDPQKDFAPVSEVSSTDFVLVTNAQRVPARTLQEYVTWAKGQKPLFFGTFGAGTIGHFGGDIFADAAKIPMEPVHYKSTGDALTGILNGDVQALLVTPSLAAAHIKSSKLRALAMTGPTRSQVLPDVPTFKEAGYPDVQFTAWFGVFAPAKTPPEILDKLNAEVAKAARAPDTRAKLEEAGYRVTATSREEFAQAVREDTARWAKVVKSTGFKAQD